MGAGEPPFVRRRLALVGIITIAFVGWAAYADRSTSGASAGTAPSFGSPEDAASMDARTREIEAFEVLAAAGRTAGEMPGDGAWGGDTMGEPIVDGASVEAPRDPAPQDSGTDDARGVAPRAAPPGEAGDATTTSNRPVPMGLERRAYDVTRSIPFAWDDRDPRRGGCVYDLSDYDGRTDAKRRVWDIDAVERPPGLRRITPADGRGPAYGRTFEGPAEDLDAYERALDARTFAGGRDVTLDVVCLEAPAALLARFGLVAPSPGTSAAISATTAEVIVAHGKPAARVTLDVPEDRCAFAFAGTAQAYVADYDVEISMAAYFADPIYRTNEAGLGVTARLEAARDGPDDGSRTFVLDARWRARMPALELVTTSMASGFATDDPDTVTLEVPKGAEPPSDFLGSVHMEVGDGALVGLTGGAVLVVRPTGFERFSERVRTWTRSDRSDRPPADPSRPPAREQARVTFERVDRGGAATEAVAVEVAVRPDGGVVGRPTTPMDSDDGLRALAPTGAIVVVPGPALEVRRLDVAVAPARPLDPPTRRTTFPLHTTKEPADLPQASRVVIPLRFLLRAGETAEREVVLDRGAGPEVWRVAASRVTAR